MRGKSPSFQPRALLHRDNVPRVLVSKYSAPAVMPNPGTQARVRTRVPARVGVLGPGQAGCGQPGNFASLDLGVGTGVPGDPPGGCSEATVDTVPGSAMFP